MLLQAPDQQAHAGRVGRTAQDVYQTLQIVRRADADRHVQDFAPELGDAGQARRAAAQDYAGGQQARRSLIA